MKEFVWLIADAANVTVVQAESEDEAFKLAIAQRCLDASGDNSLESTSLEDIKNQIGWFAEGDQMEPLDLNKKISAKDFTKLAGWQKFKKLLDSLEDYDPDHVRRG